MRDGATTARSSESYPVELAPPDLSAYRAGNRGIPYFTTFDSGRSGPNVLLTALVHGNELCGAIALDRLFKSGIRPIAGKLTLGFCNIAAFNEFRTDYPAISRFIDEDMNRLWDRERLEGGRRSRECARAREIRPVVEEADFLLDIHSMQHATRPLVLSGPHEKGRRLAQRVGAPALIVMDSGHASGRRMRDYDFFDAPDDPRASLLVECGQHWARESAEVATEVAWRFLHATGMIDEESLAAQIGTAAPEPQKVVEITHAITVGSADFHFHRDYIGLEVIPEAGTELGRDGGEPVVTPYDDCILIMPSRRLSPGLTAVRLGRFVE